MTQAEGPRSRVLALSTVGFTLAFAVWTMFGILGVPIRKEFGLSDVQLGWLLAVAVLGGALPRLFFGVLADRYGGGAVFTALLLATVPGALLVSQAHSYPELLFYALWIGLAGNTFSAGIAWCSAWFPRERQGFALGVFGAGNVGASVTNFIGPALIALVPAGGAWGFPGGWRFVPVLYTFTLVAMTAAMWLFLPRPDRRPGSQRSFLGMFRPLRSVRVWRFGLYYVVVFGAYVALSLWLPKYYVDVFGLPLGTAALLTALFIFPAALMRPLGGWVSDHLGARPVMYGVLGATTLLAFLLSLPGAVMSVGWFTLAVASIGVCAGLGMAAVYKFIPQHFPGDVGAVGGLVGLLGALGGFALPALFGYTSQFTGVPQTAFLILFLLSGISLVWLHTTVRSIVRAGMPVSPHAFEHASEPNDGAPTGGLRALSPPDPSSAPSSR